MAGISNDFVNLNNAIANCNNVMTVTVGNGHNYGSPHSMVPSMPAASGNQACPRQANSVVPHFSLLLLKNLPVRWVLAVLGSFGLELLWKLQLEKVSFKPLKNCSRAPSFELSYWQIYKNIRF
jgi:hypothetical protein